MKKGYAYEIFKLKIFALLSTDLSLFHLLWW